jgi:hypothetical protein
MRALAIALTLAWIWPAGSGATDSARAAPDSDLCEAAAFRAAAAENVPLDVLRAIALAETGGGRGGGGKPWPWTTNVEGVGAWHATRADALAHIAKRHAEGARSYDVGCFQINRRWHGSAFDSLEEMFDPDANALYAARFLKSLKQETGDWTRAAGWYHSRTPELAAKYRGRVQTILAGLSDPPHEAAMLFAAPRPAPRAAGQIHRPQRAEPLASAHAQSLLRRALPLFVALAAAGGRSQGAAGSLMPMEQSSGRPLLAAARPLFD